MSMVNNFRACFQDDVLAVANNGGSQVFDKSICSKVILLLIHVNTDSMATIL